MYVLQNSLTLSQDFYWELSAKLHDVGQINLNNVKYLATLIGHKLVTGSL